MTINGVYILIVVGAWAAYKLGMRFGVDSAPDRENRSERYCSQCGQVIPGRECPRCAPDRENGSAS